MNERLQLTTLPLSALAENPDNPRTSFSEEGIRELAQAIEAQGLLQNLVVTPLAKPAKGNGATHQVVAGHRRLAALRKLAKDGTVAADFAVPVQITSGSQADEVLAAALVENVSREDIPPLDEAEAFKKLLTFKGWDKERIAADVGKTVRHVELRLALVDRLIPEAQKALRNGNISLAIARALTTAPDKGLAESVLKDVLADPTGDWTADMVKEELTAELPPVEWAVFDVEEYTGDLVADHDTAEQWFADAGQALELQKNAITKMIAEAEAAVKNGELAFVDVIDNRRGEHFRGYLYEEAAKNETAGRVIEIGYHHHVTVRDQLRRAAEEEEKRDVIENLAENLDAAAKTAAATPRTPQPPVTKGHLIHAHNRKTLALQDALAASPKMAMRLACLALLGGGTTTRIKPLERRKEDIVTAPAVAEGLAEFKSLGIKVADDHTGHFGSPPVWSIMPGYEFRFENDQAKLWTAITALDDKAVERLFTLLVAANTGTFNDYEPAYGDNPVVIDIAQKLGLAGNEKSAGLGIRTGDLDGVKKAPLVAVADRAGVTPGKSVKATKEAAETAARASAVVVPTFTFADDTTVHKAMQGLEVYGEKLLAGIAEPAAPVDSAPAAEEKSPAPAANKKAAPAAKKKITPADKKKATGKTPAARAKPTREAQKKKPAKSGKAAKTKK